MRIVEVISRRQLREFVNFPDRLYAGCPQYVPALHTDQIQTLTSNAALEYCSHRMWLAVDDQGQTCGRICAMINPRYNALYDRKCCRFGWFDTVNDLNVAKALIETAEAWARQMGMTQIHGPLFFNTLGKQGMVVEGFENIPQATTLYNFSYYPTLLEALGFTKECDWLQYRVDTTKADERIKNIARRLKERYHLHSESIETLKKDPEKIAGFFKLYNEAFSRRVYNFIPFTDAEIRQEVKGVIGMLRDEYCSILCEENGDIAAFGITFPSLSAAMQKAKGRLLPFGWYHILRAIRGHGNPVCDLMIIGAADKWEGKGITAAIHVDMEHKFEKLNIEYNITNPQIEDNKAVNVWSTTYGSKLYTRRRCYIKNIN